MQYKITITPNANASITQIALRLDEYLKEYWGSGIYYIRLISDRIFRNIDLFEPGMNWQEQSLNFYAFQKVEDYKFLQKSDYSITPPKVEIFGFHLKQNYIEVRFYNSFENNERERQFYKIAENIKAALKTDIPLVRIYPRDEYCTEVMHKYRKSEGRIGFELIPTSIFGEIKACDYIFIYWSDFAYLRPFIKKVYPQKWNKDDIFDDTSSNFINKNEWSQILVNIKQYKTNDVRLSAFFTYIAEWIENQLSWANYICIYGNL
ncbi:MAG: hypothetical protein E6767_13990 [Dysgonomonas sp.]|nr:hypothetical protein [Dysgonomonas sp.]